MNKLNRHVYVYEVIANSIDIDPQAMYYVWEKTNSLMSQSTGLREKDEMLSAFVDEIIMGIDRNLEKYISRHSQTHGAFYQNDLDRWIEAQPELKFVQDHLTEWAVPHAQNDFVWFEKPFTGMEILVPEQSLPTMQERQPFESELSNDFIWFEGSLDRWIEAQPDLKQALDRWLDTPPADEANQKASQPIRKDKVA
jgi:hypothetical protein